MSETTTQKALYQELFDLSGWGKDLPPYPEIVEQSVLFFDYLSEKLRDNPLVYGDLKVTRHAGSKTWIVAVAGNAVYSDFGLSDGIALLAIELFKQGILTRDGDVA